MDRSVMVEANLKNAVLQRAILTRCAALLLLLVVGTRVLLLVISIRRCCSQ